MKSDVVLCLPQTMDGVTNSGRGPHRDEPSTPACGRPNPWIIILVDKERAACATLPDNAYQPTGEHDRG